MEFIDLGFVFAFMCWSLEVLVGWCGLVCAERLGLIYRGSCIIMSASVMILRGGCL
jgi:hypothetical protein